ncbi:MAG TPA: hypothetical protein VEU62_00595 [Bryobacterales bacterium]|nr:hypothetical protein [Bryobacterales bacterium]
MTSWKARALLLMTLPGLLVAAWAAPPAEKPAPGEQQAIQFERAKRAAAGQAEARREATVKKHAEPSTAKQAKSETAGVSEAIRFERAKRAAAEAQAQKEDAPSKTERAAARQPAH